MSRAAALAVLVGRQGVQSAAKLAGLPSCRFVTTKEIADASGGALTDRTVQARCRLFDEAPDDPRALPYHRPFGRPYRVAHDVAVKFLGVEGAR